jgi:hypothetical protein
LLDLLERAEFDVFKARPSLGWRDAAPILWKTWTWEESTAKHTKGT